MSVKNLAYIYFFVCLAVSIAEFPDGFLAAALSGVFCVGIYFLLRKFTDHGDDLIKLFLIALIIRTVVSSTIDVLQATNFFALDWTLYDSLGYEVSRYWTAGIEPSLEAQRLVFTFRGTVWGIGLLVGAVYSIVGRNLLAAQLVIATISSAAAPFAYLCTIEIFNNRRAARIAGYFVVFTPSLVLWSSLLLKDGLIVFFLVLVMFTAVRLQRKLDLKYIVVLVIALLGVFALRNYIFYITSVAVIGGFLIGQKTNVFSIAGRASLIVVIGVSLGFLGLLDNSKFELENMTNLKSVALSRQDLSHSAASGFGQEYDVSTLSGAIQVLPIGLAYLIFSPFPWELTSSLAVAAFPETMLWWIVLIPVSIGIIYAFRHRLRKCISILMFTVMLALGYAVLQGNVGTAYRQRAQIQIFLFIFAAVGITILMEKREDKKLARQARRRHFAKQQQGIEA
jgi:4-amino-4-deoxy-L-arabinose transferase-like glycosyltransferase